jgi:hypothetical protein
MPSLHLRVLLGLLCFQVSLRFPSLIYFLQLMEVLEHNLFICPFVTPFGFLHFQLRLGSSLFVLPFPFCWVFCLMKFTKVSSLRFSLNEVYWGVQLQFNKPKKHRTTKKNNQTLINIYVLPFKAMTIMTNYCFSIHMNVKEFKPKIHLMKF